MQACRMTDPILDRPFCQAHSGTILTKWASTLMDFEGHS